MAALPLPRLVGTPAARTYPGLSRPVETTVVTRARVTAPASPPSDMPRQPAWKALIRLALSAHTPSAWTPPAVTPTGPNTPSAPAFPLGAWETAADSWDVIATPWGTTAPWDARPDPWNLLTANWDALT